MSLDIYLKEVEKLIKLSEEIKNDLLHFKSHPDANRTEKLKMIHAKLGFIGKSAGVLKANLPKLAATDSGGLSKLDAIKYILKKSRSLSDFYRSELGITANDFNEANIDSGMANQLINDGVSDGLIKSVGNNKYLPATKAK